MTNKPKLFVHGMHGLGDNFHQRAVIRKLLEAYEVWLETSWPTIYYDLPVHCVSGGTKLRTQLKNVEKENELFEPKPNDIDVTIKIWYDAKDIMPCGSVLGAMFRYVKIIKDKADFSFQPKKEWRVKIREMIKSWNPTKPILFYRPLVVRNEWKNCDVRNPDISTYHELLSFIRDEFFVVSVADVNETDEWIVSKNIHADKEFHRGELDFTMLSALVAESALVFASPGFAVPMARSIGTPVICVFGGFENSSSFSLGYSPYLGIDTIKPCSCYSRKHACCKRIAIPDAKRKIRSFINAHVTKNKA